MYPKFSTWILDPRRYDHDNRSARSCYLSVTECSAQYMPGGARCQCMQILGIIRLLTWRRDKSPLSAASVTTRSIEQWPLFVVVLNWWQFLCVATLCEFLLLTLCWARTLIVVCSAHGVAPGELLVDNFQQFSVILVSYIHISMIECRLIALTNMQ